MKFSTLVGIFILVTFVTTTIAQETTKIGLNYPKTGRYAEQGLQQRMGAFMAVEEINAAGGILNKPVELIFGNTGSNPVQGAENTARMIDRDNAVMVFGGISGSVVIASSLEAKKRNRLYFGTVYANEVTGVAAHTHVFREPYSADMAAKVIGRYLSDEYAGKKFFYITANYGWGWSTEASVREFTNTTDTSEHRTVLTPFPKAHIRDFSEALREAATSNADVLVVVLFGGDMVRTLILAHELGLKKRMQIVVPNITLSMANEVGPTIMEGVIAGSPWNWQVPYKYGYKRGQQFVEDFSKRYNQRPSAESATAYSVLYQYKEAVERAGTFDTQAVIKALEGYRYSFLKDEQEWRSFDHQNVQTVYAVKSKPRDEVTADEYRGDYFEIVRSMSGDEAAQSEAEWRAERIAAGKPDTLQ